MKTIHVKSAIIALSISSLQILYSIPTVQASQFHFYQSYIVLNGNNISSPMHIVAKDPLSHQDTAWMPVYYLEQIFKKTGLATNWNGSVWNFQSFNKNIPFSLPIRESLNKSNMAFSINGTIIGYAPRITVKDPSGGNITSYVPIYYVMKYMKYLGINPGWNGTSWTMSSDENSENNSTPTTYTSWDVYSNLPFPSDYQVEGLQNGLLVGYKFIPGIGTSIKLYNPVTEESFTTIINGLFYLYPKFIVAPNDPTHVYVVGLSNVYKLSVSNDLNVQVQLLYSVASRSDVINAVYNQFTSTTNLSISPNGTYLPVQLNNSNQFIIINTISGKSGQITLNNKNYNPDILAINDTGVIALSGINAPYITLLNINGTIIKNIPVSRVTQLTFSSDGDTLYALNGKVKKINVQNGIVSESIGGSGGQTGIQYVNGNGATSFSVLQSKNQIWINYYGGLHSTLYNLQTGKQLINYKTNTIFSEFDALHNEIMVPVYHMAHTPHNQLIVYSLNFKQIQDIVMPINQYKQAVKIFCFPNYIVAVYSDNTNYSSFVLKPMK